MFRKVYMVLLVILLPIFILAVNETIDKNHWSYNDIKTLVDAGVIDIPLNKDVLTRQEVVEYIKNGVNNILYAQSKTKASATGSDAEIKEYIKKLYDLVKAYQTDMLKTGEKLDSIIETIGDLKVKKQEIEKKQENLLNRMGLRINGESSAYMTDVLMFGNKFMYLKEPAKRYRPITQYIDLRFSLHSTKELYAEATFRLENLFGGFWGSQDIYGLKRLFVQGEYPISFILGDYQGKLTPLTLWAVDDERPYEAKVFADKRDMNKKELYLIDNSWPLNGGKLHTIINLFDTVDFNFLVMGARLGEAGKSNYKAYDPSSGVFIPVTYKHDQYLLAGRFASDFATGGLITLGGNFSQIKDAKDTGKDASDYNAPVLDNQVMSVDTEVNVMDGLFKAKAELAKSLYSADAARDRLWLYIAPDGTSQMTHKYVVDSAVVADAEVNYFNTKLKVKYKNVREKFTAYAAQTRIYDERNNEMYLTQNSTWNISAKPPSYEIGGRIYPFTKYNPAINPSYTGIALLPYNVLGYPMYENNTNPYGDATPNRQGYSAILSGNYGDDFVVAPYVKFEVATEIQPSVKDCPRVFTVLEGGGKLSIWQISLYGSYKMEDTNNNTKNSVAFTSVIMDAGLEYEIIKKKLLAYIGYKHIEFNGYDFVMLPGGSWGLPTTPFDWIIDSIGFGMEYKIAKPATLGISFTTTNLEDMYVVTKDKASLIGKPTGYKMSSENSFGVQELDVKVSINF